MNDKYDFAKEYLCEWIPNEIYDKAYGLWIKYHYECERFDEFVCTGGRDEYGFIKPANNNEFSTINQFAINKRSEIISLAKEYGIPYEKMKSANKDVSKLTLYGLVKEYNRLFRL